MENASSTGCERCKRLEQNLRDLQAERDELWLALAKERQRTNAILLSFPLHQQKLEPVVMMAPPAPPPPVDLGPQPLRYRVADVLNNGVKKLTPFAHGGAKKTVQKLLLRNQ